MKRFIYLILCYLLVTSSLVAFAENYVPSPTLDGKFPIENPYQILVNKEHKLPDNWPDYIKLVETTNSLGESFLVEDV
ncbi:hypothetical protein IIZ77_00225, partial [Candidatus Saccharibacteria bacterium]|nr:hypothetical protein [Candidatus Saccharibacteria bacterium]